jgi:hypothetical protein
MRLLFIDESTVELPDSRDRLVALTSVLVPAAGYDSARTLFYRAFAQSRNWGGRVITTRDGRQVQVADGTQVREPPPELHGVKLLDGASDDEKIDAYGAAVRLVGDGGLTIYRVCLRFKQAPLRKIPTDVARYLECWSWLQELLTPVLEQEFVVPIWDAGNAGIQEQVPELMRLRDHFRALGLHAGLPDPTTNLLGEVFFADSRNSVFIQIADLISYILMARDKLRNGWAPSTWIQRVASIGDNLPAEAVHEMRGILHVQGGTHALERY